jgi:hypothetical protein
MPPQQRIGRNDGVEFKQGFAPYPLGLARQKSTLRVCEPDSLSSQPLLEQLILGLEKLDDEQLMPMDPARHNYKQKRQQWRHRTHASILPRPVVRIYGQHALGAFDLIIGATAIRYGFPVLTTNAADFRRMPGCDVEVLE